MSLSLDFHGKCHDYHGKIGRRVDVGVLLAGQVMPRSGLIPIKELECMSNKLNACMYCIRSILCSRSYHFNYSVHSKKWVLLYLTCLGQVNVLNG